MQSWMKAQNDYTRDYLSHLPDRDDLIKRVESLDNAAIRVGGLSLYGSRYFYFKMTPQDQTPKLYVRDSLKGGERLLADPQVLGDSSEWAKKIKAEAKKKGDKTPPMRFTISEF